MRVQRYLAWSVSIGLALLAAPEVHADRPKATEAQRRQATEGFSSCREIAAEGDATPCWRVWMKKFGRIGSEAEVAYAEEHSGARPVEPSTRTPPQKQPGTAGGPARANETPAAAPPSRDASPPSGNGSTATPAATRSRTEKKDLSCLSNSDCTGGALCKKSVCVYWWREREVPAAGPEPSPAASASNPPPPPADKPATEAGAKAQTGEAPDAKEPGPIPPGAAAGQVLDLCTLKPRVDSNRFVRQRAVVFAPAGADALDQDEGVRKTGPERLVREVFAARFPLDRFHNVVATFPGRKEWATAETISMADLEAELGAPAGASPSQASKPAFSNEREFVRYSLGCTDYAVFPTIETQSVSWDEVEKQSAEGKSKFKKPKVELTGAMGIFKRDGNAFKLVSTVRASVPGMLDFATDAVAGAIPDMNLTLGALGGKAAGTVLPLPSHVSALPDPSCQLGKQGTDGAAGLGACPKKGAADGALAAGSIEERAGPICKEADSDKTSSQRMAEAIVICEVRSRTAQMTRKLQKSARAVEGWQLFAPLQVGAADDSQAPAMSLGSAEGMKVGYGFRALGADKVELGYFKVVSVGPGAEAGIKSPSQLELRYGEAPEGTRLEEYPLMGIGIMPWFSTVLVTQNHGRTALPSEDGTVEGYKLATLAVGGGATVSYDLSGPLHFSETYLRIGGGYHAGVGGEKTSMTLAVIEVAAEKGFYLGKRLVWYNAIGGAVSMVNVRLKTSSAVQEETTYGTSQYGVLVRSGLDLMLIPDASLRLELLSRLNLGKSKYTDKDGNELPEDNPWTRRNDHFTQLGVGLALAWTF